VSKILQEDLTVAVKAMCLLGNLTAQQSEAFSHCGRLQWLFRSRTWYKCSLDLQGSRRRGLNLSQDSIWVKWE
ncbi:hypothetical protein BJX66DRAFT_318685, partial [Aspergillus keveii]